MKHADNTKNNNHTEEENVINENCFKSLQEMVRDVAEVTKLLTEVTKKDNAYSAQKETKKIEKKVDPYHVDYAQNYYNNNNKIMNRKQEDTKHASKYTIEIDKDYSLKLEDSSSPNRD